MSYFFNYLNFLYFFIVIHYFLLNLTTFIYFFIFIFIFIFVFIFIFIFILITFTIKFMSSFRKLDTKYLK
jgi:hypothetical protein